MNNNIINQFEKLLAFIEYKIKIFKEEGNTKDQNIYGFKQRHTKRVISIIKNYHEKITKKNFKELNEIDGIGKGTIDRIKEILETKKLNELKEFEDIYKENNYKKKNKVIQELSEIINMGPTKAKELYDMGVKSVSDLKNKIKKGEIQVNSKIELGLKYYGVLQVNIPRKEIENINKLLDNVIKKINKKYKYNIDNKYILQICGSFRREKNTSNDIDVLITKMGNPEEEENHLKRFIKKLKSPIKSNNNKPLIIDDMTDKNIETKYMGFLKFKNNPVRRIDVRFVPFESYYFALLYFTGSKELNKKMREIAKKKGYTLSEYGLVDSDGNSFNAKSEKEIFKKLGLEYLPPKLR